MKVQVICLAVCITLAFQYVSAQSQSDNSSRISCYECSSFLKSQHCDSVNDDTPVVKCDPGVTMCRKVEQHIHLKGSDKIRTFRQCAPSGDLGKCLERTGTKFKSWYCQCKGDLCNGAGTPVVSFALLTSLVTAFFFLKNRV